MKCLDGYCRSPTACGGFGYCRELNMAKTFHNGKITLHAGDCLDVLKAMPENSIDAVVTDPPYHLTVPGNKHGKSNLEQPSNKDVSTIKSPAVRALAKGFMGQKWDGGDIAFRPGLWAEVLRVLKPGGHMVCFGGTRTYHRLACAIEDAGFEVRDAIMWHYGSGFPKSHDVSKGIDRAAGVERDVIGVAGKSGSTRSCMTGDFAGGEYLATTPATDAARQWQGYGTALKPSTEIICLARKPLSESTVAANVLRWGTGALNIDGCRVGTSGGTAKTNPAKRETVSVYGNGLNGGGVSAIDAGRWPANLVHDGSPEVLAGFPETAPSPSKVTRGPSTSGHGSSNRSGEIQEYPCHGDSGSAARFFYTAKAGSWDRINRVIESVEIEWNTGQKQCRAVLPVDTEQLRRKGIVGSASDISNEWNTFLSGSNITDLCRKACKCTIKTATSSTTTSQTWSWLTRLLTNESIRAANYEAANGSSHAETAEMSGPSLIIIRRDGISPWCRPCCIRNAVENKRKRKAARPSNYKTS
jgi:hypothetical protein